jgi:hypothetical protein
MKHVEIVGLMTMAPYEADPEKTRPVFAGLRQLQWTIQQQNIANAKVPYLSMGMSNDFEVAIEEGATHVRIGSLLVGDE